MDVVTILGGTGPTGKGLAIRLATAGKRVLLGSRSEDRARAAVEAVRAAVPHADVAGGLNAAVVADAPVVVLAVPFEGAEAMVAEVRDAVRGRILVDVVVPLAFERGFCAVSPIAGASSVGEWLHAQLPGTRVVSAFKNTPAEDLLDPSRRLAGDVLLCGEDAGARAAVAALVRAIPALRPVDAGRIGNARYLEALTALLINLNRQHGGHASVAVLGLGDRAPARSG